MEEVEANPGLIFDKIDAWLDGFFKLLPNIGVAIVVFILFWYIAKAIGGLVRRSAKHRDRPSHRRCGQFVDQVGDCRHGRHVGRYDHRADHITG